MSSYFHIHISAQFPIRVIKNYLLRLWQFVVISGMLACSPRQNNSEKILKSFILSNHYYTQFNDSIHTLANKTDTSYDDHQLKAISLIIHAQSNLLYADYEQAILELSRAKKLLHHTDSDTIKLRILFGLGNAYTNLGNYDEALSNYYEAEKIALKIKSDFHLGKSYGGIAQVYQMKEDIPNAKKFITQAITLLSAAQPSYYNAQLILANLFGMSGQIDSAIYIDNKCLHELKDSKQPQFRSFFFNNKGNCYMYSGVFDSAAFYFTECLKIDTQYAETKQIADSYINLVSVFALKKDSIQLKKYIDLAFNYCNRLKFLPGKLQLFQVLDNYYSSISNQAQSLAIKDSLLYNYKKLYNQKTEDKIAELKIKYDDEKKQREIINQKEKILFQNLMIVLILIIFSLAVVFFIYYLKQIKKDKVNEINKIQLEQQEKVTQSIFESEQHERIRIARDLHDSIGQKLIYLKMNLTQLNLSEQNLLSELDQTIKEVRAISHNLIPEELNFGLFTAIENLVADIAKNTTINLLIDENCTDKKIKLSEAVNIYRIFQELITNTLKHAKANIIDIKVSIINRNLNLILNNDGQTFDISHIEKSQGLGWKNIKARINLLKGNIHFEPDQKNQITILIPIKSETEL